MPKVHTYMTRARKGDKPNLKCAVCGKDIEPGQERYEWEFRYGGRRVQHVSCGYPKRSQLTQSKMADVYATIESVEKDWGSTPEEVESNLQSVVEQAETTKTEYEEAAENFGSQGPSQEKADELESFISSLQSALNDISGDSKQEEETEEDFIGRLHEAANAAVDEVPE